MPFAMGETIGGISHLLTKWQRQLLRQPVTRHIEAMAARGAAVSAVPQGDGVLKTCSICGFALARLELAGGWSAETCSAVGLRVLIGNRRFSQWASRLSSAPEETDAVAGASGDGPAGQDSPLRSAPGLPAKLV